MEDKADKARALYKGEALAPMVRASTTPLRALAIQYGADFVYTEELVDRAILETKRIDCNYNNDKTIVVDYVKDTSKMSQRVQRRMQRDSLPAPLLLRIDRAVEQDKLVLQLGTGEPELALQAALHVHRDVDAIDVNMGCPKPFSVSGGMGSALLSDPDRACRIIKTLSNNLPANSNKPVSAKIRLLPGDARHTVDFVTALINAGANAVAIHGRRVGDESQTPADWQMLENVVALTKSKFPRVPILVNGDFYTRHEFTDFMNQSGANGVLLARPALYNTSIFRKPMPPPILLHDDADESETQKCDSCISYDSNLLLDKTTVIQDYLRHVTKYNMHHKNAKYVICEMMNNRRAPLSRVPFLKQVYPGRQTIALMSSCTSVADICRLWNVNGDNNDTSKNRNNNSGNNNNNNLSTIPAALNDDAVIPARATATTNHNSSASIVVVPIPTAGEHKYDDSYLLKMAEDPTESAPAARPSSAVMAAAALAAPSISNDTNVLDAPPPPLAKKIRVDGGDKN